jgi:hypothetical protein
MRAHHWMILTVIFAFISVISFFQIDSAWSDAHKFNGLLGWLGIGIVTGLIAIFCLVNTAKAGGGGNSSGIGAR